MQFLSREGDLSVNLFAAFLILGMNVKVKILNVNLLKFDREVRNQK